MGLVAAIGHMTFIPVVKGPIQRIVENKSKGNATADLETWLSVHKVRMLVADFPAWLSCFGAVLATVKL